jgi:tetratricopeptide (TPR) repeat protein
MSQGIRACRHILKTVVYILTVFNTLYINAQTNHEKLDFKIKTLGNLSVRGQEIEISKYIKNNNMPDSVRGLAYCYLAQKCSNQEQELALRYYNQSLIYFLNHPERYGETQFNLAILYRENYQFLNSILAFKKAIDIFRDRNDIIFLSKTYSQLGHTYKKNGEIIQAEEYHKLALSLPNLPEVEKAKRFVNYGIFLTDLGKYEPAINLYKRAYSIFKINHISEYDSYIFWNMGFSYFRSRNFPKAIEVSNKALSLIQYDDLRSISQLKDNIGVSYLHLGELDKSFEILNKNLKLSEKHGFKENGVYYESMALYYQKVGLTEYALEYIKKAILCIMKNFRPRNNIQNPTALQISAVNDLDVKLLLQYFQRKQELLKQGKITCVDILFVIDSLIDLMRQEHTEQGSKLFWREKTHSLYENALETCYQLKDHKTAFYFMEKSRAILLLDALKDLDAKKALSSTQQSTEQKLRYQLIGLQNKLETISETEKGYAANYQKLIQAKENYQKFIKGLELTNPSYYRLKYDNQYISLQDWQKYLDLQHQSSIQYFVGEKAVYGLAITANGITFKKINREVYLKTVHDFNALVAQGPPHTQQYFQDFKVVSHKLFTYIFKPFNLPKGRVVVSSDGQFVPFGALMPSVSSDQYLVNHYAFSYAYSANVLIKHKSKAAICPKFLGVSPVDFKTGLGVNSLPKSDKVAQNIENDYYDGTTLLKENATLTNFIKNAAHYNILQLFTHAQADSTNEGSKMYFHDQTLSLNELYSLHPFNADLAVLSACQTNLGKMAVGEGVLSFARGFAYLNVPSTVSTLWRVNDESTYSITYNFYKYLKNGMSKDVALQKAQLEFIQVSGSPLPYFWSGMVLIGNADPISLAREYYFLWLGVILMVLIGIVWLVWGRRNGRFS